MVQSINHACTLLKPLHVEIREVPIPEAGPDDVLVQVESTGICGSDLHNYSHGGVGKRTVKEPLVLGHESAGIVIKAGSQVTNVVVGDRVAIQPTQYCRRCPACKNGKTNVCYHVKQAAMPPVHGTLTKYYACDSDYVTKIPETVSWEVAGCIQPLAVAMQLAKRAKFAAGQSIAIFGCGPLGCMVMAAARAHGVAKIVAFDLIQGRVDFALKHWADYAVIPEQPTEGQDYEDWAEDLKTKTLKAAGVDPFGVDIAIEASGAESCMHAGVTFVHSGGTYIQAGLGRAINLFPTVLVVAKELNVLGTVRYTEGCFEAAIDLLARGKINLSPMITAIFPMSRSAEALEAVRAGKDLKVVIMNQQV